MAVHGFLHSGRPSQESGCHASFFSIVLVFQLWIAGMADSRFANFASLSAGDFENRICHTTISYSDRMNTSRHRTKHVLPGVS